MLSGLEFINLPITYADNWLRPDSVPNNIPSKTDSQLSSNRNIKGPIKIEADPIIIVVVVNYSPLKELSFQNQTT